MTRIRRALSAVCGLGALSAALMTAATPAAAQDHSRMYPQAELAADAKRLETAFRKIYQLGVAPALTPAEKRALSDLELVFPDPDPGDAALEFYTYSEGGKDYLAAPILSLKALEDLTTAYAYLYSKNRSLEPIDLYYAMMRREDPSGFPGGVYPAILPALDVPGDAYKHAPVDSLSLSLRNEAFAFVMLHEMAHIVLDHQDYDKLTPAQSRAEETAADRFALDVLARTGTSPFGAMLLFQAQVYSLANRGQFPSEKAWSDFMAEKNFHPLTTDRLRAMATMTAGEFARRRPGEREIWTFVGDGFQKMVAILEDRELQDCIARASRQGRVEALKESAPGARLFQRYCR